jgi:UDP-N-acetyl-D-galactosamine dehydrogenase
MDLHARPSSVSDVVETPSARNSAPALRVGVLGLGYVGLPLAVTLARHVYAVGYDIDSARIAELRSGHDRTGELTAERLRSVDLDYCDDPAGFAGLDIYIVTAPTPVDAANRPDLGPLLAASETVGRMIDGAKRPIIVFESTVWPGVTEDVCGPAIERASGLRRGVDFFLGYSPERINPGDREHTVDRIVKVVAGENEEVTERLANLYGRVTSAGTFKAASIKTAEAAKVIENAQRDINIAFMNEITQIFAKLGISSLDVLEAAGTKWNFLPFRPGLVGGHCIGVDPYYLSHCAQSVGHLPRVILAGRAINDGMGAWVADTIHSHRGSKAGRVLVLGLAFKPDVPDLRNSRTVDLVRRLEWLGHEVVIHDPLADPKAARHEYGLAMSREVPEERFDVVLCAVAHEDYRGWSAARIAALTSSDALVADLPGIWRDRVLPVELDRWVP